MDDPVAAGRDGRPLVLLLDVGVKAVVHHPARGVPHGIDESRCLRGGRQEVVLEPIEVFAREQNAVAFRPLGHRLHRADAALEFLLGRRRAGELADRRVERPAEDLRPGRRAAGEHPVEPLDRRVPNPGIFGDRVGLRRHDRDRGRPEPQVVEPLAESLERRRVRAVEDWDLDAVEPHPLEFFEQSVVLGRQGVGPEQQVHADLHR